MSAASAQLLPVCHARGEKANKNRVRPCGCTLQKTTYNSNLYNRAFPGGNALFFVYAVISLQRHRQRCRAPRPICTEPFKSFCALDNHPLFAVY